MKKMRIKVALASFVVAMLAIVGLTSCDMTFGQAIVLAKIGGQASARTWVLAAKPTPEQVKAVSGALDVTRQALDNYSGKGDFSDALPQIYEGIDKLKLPDGLKAMADSLAEAVVFGVDFWFSQNPQWKDKGVESTKIAKAYVDSARSALPTATETKVYRSSRSVKAREMKK